ncbi:MAG: hypothetical protein IJI98_02630 [Methanosphaera sp.]|nr:hypothetical protein [Methanosphaera sp.]
MRTKDKIISIILLIIFLYIVANLGALNSFLTLSTDKTFDVGNSQIVVPESWNTTSELNMTDKAKTNDSITNKYVIWNIWENWPEDHITRISTEKFRQMEKGGYEVVNESNIKLGGKNVSKQYFYNPSRDTNTTWDCMGVNYVFNIEDKNYAVQIQYFTKIDYQNQSYLKEVDDRVEDFLDNIHNKQYDGFFSRINHLLDYFGIKF